MNLLITFIFLNIVNVILQTFRSIVTIKCGKIIASFVNAIAYGLYTIVIIYTVCDLPLYVKALIVALCNLIGVFIVKLIEEKNRKDRLWRIEMTAKDNIANKVFRELETANISFSITRANTYTIFACYCETQKDSKIVAQIKKENNLKSFVIEQNATLL